MFREYEATLSGPCLWPTRGILTSRRWVGYLLSEYRALNLVKYGERLVEVRVKPVGLPKNTGIDVRALYKAIVKAKKIASGKEQLGDEVLPEEMEKIVKYARYAYEYGDPGYLVAAARELATLVRGSDEYIAVWAYPDEVKPLNLTREDLERARKLSDRVLQILAPLGGEVEAVLTKLVFSGYRKGIARTIEGLREEDAEFLEELLDKPFDRVAILYAYGRIANLKELVHRMMKEVIIRGTGKASIFSEMKPTIEVANI